MEDNKVKKEYGMLKQEGGESGKEEKRMMWRRMGKKRREGCG